MVMWSKRQVAIVVAVLVSASAGMPGGWAQDYQVVREVEIEDLDSLHVPAAQYVGNQVCKECHASAYQVWLGTKHARSYVFLGSETGKAIAEKMEIDTDRFTRSAKCLVCHVTAADAPATFRAPGFHIEEGVKCEACHGPGGQHVREGLTLEREAVLASRMKILSEDDCLVCHKEEPSHEMLHKKPFDFKKFKARIDHPESRSERLDLLYERPQAVLSISLRTFLSNFY